VCIDKRDDDSCTSLHYACELGYRSIAEALIEQGACVVVGEVRVIYVNNGTVAV